MKNPTVFYSGNTVARSGNTIGIRGEYLDQNWKATLTDGQHSQPVELLQQVRQSFKFQIPENFREGLYTLTLAGEKPLTITLNEPKVKWLQGDEGATSTSNGWVRVQGECLRVRDDAPISLTLTDESGRVISLAPDRVYDDYSVGFKFDNLAEGAYQAVYSNGLAECPCGTVTVAPSPESLWPQQVYNVVEHGVPDDGLADCTQPLKALLEKVGQAGGGIIYFPRGRYRLSEPFTLPRNLVIRGDGMDKTQLFWRDAWQEREPNTPWNHNRFNRQPLPRNMLIAESDLAVEDIEFVGGRLGGLFRVGSKEAPAKNVRFQRVRVYVNAVLGVGAGNNRFQTMKDISEEVGHYGNDQFMMNVQGSNIKYLDCHFNYSGAMFKYGNDVAYLLMQRNHIGDVASIRKWIPLGELNKAIVEECEMVGKNFGCGGDNVYISRMNLHDNTEGDHEAFTTDIKGGIPYEGPAVMESETRFTFPAEVDMQKAMPGAKLVIVNGTGLGQWRRVIAVEDHTVTIDEPFTVAPDAESRLSVNYMFWNWYFTNTRVENCGPFQLYVAQGNTVFDGIEIYRSFGYVLRGTFGYNAMQNLWYNSLVNCKLINGNVFHMTGYIECFGHYDKEGYMPCHSVLQLWGLMKEKATLATVVRNCTVQDDCMIHLRAQAPGAINDVILDGNHAIDTRCGIYQEGEVPLLLENGTTYENVKDPYHFREDLGAWW